jgi:chromosome segregation ATPase
LIEAAMLFALGFLCASLLALAAVPALSRRADRLARKRAEAAFPLSLAEIAADRDHLRAELALRMRVVEQEAERGFAARAGAMQELGQRDMTIGRLERERGERDQRIGELEGELSAMRNTLDETRAALEKEQAGHAGTTATLDKRVADLANLEKALAEAKAALTRTGADLSAREEEFRRQRATIEQTEARLAGRERELAASRDAHGALRVSQVEDRTRIMVLQGERDQLAARLAAVEDKLSRSEAALAKEAQDGEQALAAAQEELAVARAKHQKEVVVVQESRDSQIAVLRAELGRLEAALNQGREERERLREEISELRKAGPGEQPDHAVLRQEIVRLADRLMSLPPKQEAAE